MVVVVPALAHGRDGEERDVMGLNPGLLDQPGLRPAGVGDPSDVPMHGGAGGDPDADTPDHPGPAAQGVERQGDRDLLQHPGLFEEDVEAVVGDPGPRVEARRMAQPQLAVQVPPGIDPEAPAVREVIVAAGLALGPVPGVVDPDRPERPAHADGRAGPDQQALEPLRTIEAAMDQPPVEADRMPRAKHESAGREKHQKGVPSEGQRPKDERRQHHPAVPERAGRIPADLGRQRIGLGREDQGVDPVGVRR